MEEKKTSLERLTPYLRICSVYVESKDKCFQLNNIAFYDEKGIIVKVGQGYFDNDEDFIFNGNVVYKLQENFSNKQNYVMKSKDSGSWGNNYILYIYIGNVDFEYKGLVKVYSNIYKEFCVNGVKVTKYIKSLQENVWRYSKKIEEYIKKIEGYNLPLEEIELKEICDNIMKYNNLLLKEEQWIKDYEPNTKDLEDNFEKVLKREE